MLHVEEHVNRQNEQEAAAFNAATIDSLEDSLVTVDLSDRITTWNHGAEKLYGYAADEVVGEWFGMLVARHDLRQVMDAMHRAAGGEHVPIFETERVRKDGRHILASTQLSSIRDEHGRIIGVSTLARDKTRDIRWREAMRESESKFRLLTETIPQLVWTCTAEGECDYVSPQWCDYTGMPVHEQLGRGWVRAVHPDDREPMHERWNAAVQCNRAFDLEYRLRNRDGSYRWFQVRGAPVRDSRGKIAKWFGTCTDVQERKQAEINLENLVAKRTAELRETITQLEAFSYSMAHDMRAPLRAMSSFAEILQRRYGHGMDEQGRQIVCRISKAAQRLDLLIVDVLQYSRLLRGPAPLQPVDLNELVADMIATSPGWRPPRADVVVEGELPEVMGHAGFLSQCVSNLIENAIKFVPRGVHPQVRIFGNTNGPVARLYVRDNGIGIAPGDQERIFKIFERVPSVDEYEGTGIGLAIVQRAAKRMGGRAGVESEPGKGSTFWIELRAA